MVFLWTPVQEWATVLASPHVLRVADACSTAEDAALGAALSGKGEGVVSAALDACLQGIHHWQHGIIEVPRVRDAFVRCHTCVQCISTRCTCLCMLVMLRKRACHL